MDFGKSKRTQLLVLMLFFNSQHAYSFSESFDLSESIAFYDMQSVLKSQSTTMSIAPPDDGGIGDIGGGAIYPIGTNFQEQFTQIGRASCRERV